MALEFLDVGRIERHARTFLAAALIDENQIAIFDKAAQGSQRHLQSICSLPRSEQLYVAAIHASVPDKAYRRFVNCETPLSSNDPRDGASPSRQARRRGSTAEADAVPRHRGTVTHVRSSKFLPPGNDHYRT